MTSKIALFNAALGALGHRRLSDTGEAVVAGRELVEVYDQVVDECLSSDTWSFAIETAKLASAGATPSLGYSHTYTKPVTWLRTESLATDSGFENPLLAYYEDATYWSTDTGDIHVRYVSSDTGKGLDLPSWTSAFTRYVELELAHRVCMRLTQNKELKEDVGKERDRARSSAEEQDRFQPPWPTFSATAVTSRSRIVHSALMELGDIGKIAVRGEDPRRVLNRLYDEVVAECIAAGSWNFAMEDVRLDADTGVSPEYGYPKVFAKPADWVRTIWISEDENYYAPLLHYSDVDSFWSADNTPLYVRYVSNDTGLGLDQARWPAAFTRFVVLELALRGSESLIQSMMASAMMRAAQPATDQEKGGVSPATGYGTAARLAAMATERLAKMRDKARKLAKNQDAMDEGTKFPPAGSWTVARGGRNGGRRDRGSRGGLIG